jgi:hypothetical protein
MRIFHGLYNIAGIPSVMARAERMLGVESTSVCFPAANPSYVPDILEEAKFNASDHLFRFTRYAGNYEVFVFHFGHSLTADSLADVPLLKANGKKVIFYFHGCDIRQSRENFRNHRFCVCRDCWPHRCNPNRDLALEVAQRFADAIWVSTPDLLEFVPGAVLFQQPFEVRSVKFRAIREHEREGTIRIVHAPSDRMLKGTKYLVAAVEKLRTAGFDIELLLVENMPREKALECYREADIAVDQLLLGSYGTFAVELMAIGIPTICYLRDDLLTKYAEPPPIVNADPETIGDVLRDLVGRRSNWPSIAREGRFFAEKFHDSLVLANQAIATYHKVIDG